MIILLFAYLLTGVHLMEKGNRSARSTMVYMVEYNGIYGRKQWYIW